VGQTAAINNEENPMRNLSPRHAPALARPTQALSAMALLLTLAACGGGGGSDSAGPASPAPDTACQTTTTAGGTITVGSGVPGDPALPEPSSGFRLNMKPVTNAKYMSGLSTPPGAHLSPRKKFVNAKPSPGHAS
jgi:gamma-glutamyltranspeptidase/glutathione hydrolase